MGHSFDEFRVGLVVRGQDRSFFRVRARRIRGSGHSPVICLETIEGQFQGEFAPETLEIPLPSAGIFWPDGYELPARFALRIGENHRAAFLDFLKDSQPASLLDRPYGQLVLRSELEMAFLRFNEARAATQSRCNGGDPHLCGHRRFCAGCGEEGKFPQRAEKTPAHAACNETLKTFIHYCTYCGISFERREYPQLTLMYWRRKFICPAGVRVRNSSRLDAL